jgi:phosphatidylglycerophosphatase A
MLLVLIAIAAASAAVVFSPRRTVPLETVAALPMVPALAWLLERSLRRALVMTAAVALALLGAAACGAALLPAAAAAWIAVDRSGREAGAARAAIAFGVACGVTAAAFSELRFEISIPIALGSFAAVLLAPLAPVEDQPGLLERWSPAIFWSLASGCFCFLIARGAVGQHLEVWTAAVAFALVAAWIVPVSGLLTSSSALLAAWTLAAEPTALGLLGAFLWARSAAGNAAIRAERGADVFSELITCGGAGYTPKGSGTAGAVTALPVGYLLAQLDWIPRVGVVALLAAVSIWISYRYMAGRSGDPKEVVLDEHVGVLIAFAVVPWEWLWVLAAFALFRLFDIAKPWPVGWIDRKVKNPAGVMLDDYAAGLMAAGILAAVRFF